MANSYIDYTGNGSLTTFTAPSYLEKTHIQVTVDGVVKTLNTDYSIADGSTSVVFGTAPAAASEIRISRSSSPAQRLTDYTNASLLTADAMDRDANQLFFLAQEAVDAAEKTDFGAQTFYSSGTTDPSTANAGDLFFNSQTGLLKIYNGSAWESVNNRGHKQTFAISGSTTVFTPSNPVDVNTLVFLNGVLLVKGSDSDGDYTTSSTQVTLNVAVTSGVVEIISFPNAAFVGTVNAVDGVFSGDLTCDDLTTASLSLTYTPSFGFLSAKTILRETASGNFRIEGEDLQLNVSDGTSPSFGNNAVYKRIDCEAGSTGSVEIYHGANAKKLETTATGIDVTGTVTTDLVKLNPTGGAGEGGQIEFQRAVDNQTAWYVDAHGSGTDTSLRFVDNDDTSNPVNRVSMNNTGIDVTGTVDCDGLKMDDGEYAQFGTANDLQIFHSGTHSYIKDRGTGILSIQSDGDSITFHDSANARDMAKFSVGGTASLNWAGGTGTGTKLATTETGIDVTGTVEADDIILSSPNGTRYRITVANDGTLTTTAV